MSVSSLRLLKPLVRGVVLHQPCKVKDENVKVRQVNVKVKEENVKVKQVNVKVQGRRVPRSKKGECQVGDNFLMNLTF